MAEGGSRVCVYEEGKQGLMGGGRVYVCVLEGVAGGGRKCVFGEMAKWDEIISWRVK